MKEYIFDKDNNITDNIKILSTEKKDIKLYGNIRLANDLFVFQLENTWARFFTTNKILHYIQK